MMSPRKATQLRLLLMLPAVTVHAFTKGQNWLPKLTTATLPLIQASTILMTVSRSMVLPVRPGMPSLALLGLAIAQEMHHLARLITIGASSHGATWTAHVQVQLGPRSSPVHRLPITATSPAARPQIVTPTSPGTTATHGLRDAHMIPIPLPTTRSSRLAAVHACTMASYLQVTFTQTTQLKIQGSTHLMGTSKSTGQAAQHGIKCQKRHGLHTALLARTGAIRTTIGASYHGATWTAHVQLELVPRSSMVQRLPITAMILASEHQTATRTLLGALQTEHHRDAPSTSQAVAGTQQKTVRTAGATKPVLYQPFPYEWLVASSKLV